MNTLRFPIHPFLLAVYPVIVLFAHNVGELPSFAPLRPLILSLGLTVVLFVVGYLGLRDWNRAGLFVSLMLILFFSYGHAYVSLSSLQIMGGLVGRHRYLAPAWACLGIMGTIGVRRAGYPARWNPFLNFMCAALLVVPAMQLFSYNNRLRVATLVASEDTGRGERPPASEAMPDFYYIILDAYTREDLLASSYGFDNRPFLRELEKRGFYVAGCSQSNYARTSLSLGSSLNMSYVEDFLPSGDAVGMTAFIRHNRVRALLEHAGYRTVAISSGYPSTEWADADLYLRGEGLFQLGSVMPAGLTAFEELLLRTTAGSVVLDVDTSLGLGLTSGIRAAPAWERYLEIRAIFSALESVSRVPGPKFVFAHIRIPHDPYIFARDGRFLPDPIAHNPGYPDQVAYTNSRILPIVDLILEGSSVPPIVILQGDHGSPEFRDDARRMKILNAYLLPEILVDGLYPSITPVNSFRLVLDELLGTNLGRLPDRSYLSLPGSDMEFMLIPEDECPT